MIKDKKNHAEAITFILLKKLGEAFVVELKLDEEIFS